MGFAWLKGEMKARLRRSNKLALLALRRCKMLYQKGHYFVLEHPARSWMWEFTLAKELSSLPGVWVTVFWSCCQGGRFKNLIKLVHNMRSLHERLHQPECGGHTGLLRADPADRTGDTLSNWGEEESEYPAGMVATYARAVLETFRKEAAPPRLTGPRAQLLRSASRLEDPVLQRPIIKKVVDLLLTMSEGEEREHLRRLVLAARHRGTDARFLVHNPINDSALEAPYPAIQWEWHTEMAWPWKAEQHINILELAAFHVHLRARSRSVFRRSHLFLHILDSTVAAGVVAKGRSSTKALNRIARRIMATSIAHNAYPLIMWTISEWNYSDHGSRLWS